MLKAVLTRASVPAFFLLPVVTATRYVAREVFLTERRPLSCHPFSYNKRTNAVHKHEPLPFSSLCEPAVQFSSAAIVTFRPHHTTIVLHVAYCYRKKCSLWVCLSAGHSCEPYKNRIHWSRCRLVYGIRWEHALARGLDPPGEGAIIEYLPAHCEE